MPIAESSRRRSRTWRNRRTGDSGRRSRLYPRDPRRGRGGSRGRTEPGRYRRRCESRNARCPPGLAFSRMDRLRRPLLHRCEGRRSAMTIVLVAMHYQNEVMHAAGKIKVGVAEHADNRHELVANAGRLLALARGAGIPVVSVRIAFRGDHADVIPNCVIFRNVIARKAMVDGSWGAEFHEGLGPAEGEFVIKHTRVNAFHGSQLEEVLRVLKADRLIMAR